MNPDQLFQAFGTMLADVFGKQGCFRQELQLTLEEWRQLDERWLALRQMNVRKIAMGTNRELLAEQRTKEGQK
jgi:hypothetical protein